MATLDAFLSDVTLEVTGCPNPLAKHHIRRSIIEFCEKTRLLTYTATVNAVVNQATYTIAPPADHEIHAIITVTHNNAPLDPISEDWLNRNIEGWQSSKSRTASTYIFTRPTSIKLYPTPNEIGTANIFVMMAVKPTPSATTVDDKFLHYAETIAAGAKRRLMAQPGQPWTNPELAVYYGNMYMAGIGKARIDSAIGNSMFTGEIARRSF